MKSDVLHESVRNTSKPLKRTTRPRKKTPIQERYGWKGAWSVGRTDVSVLPRRTDGRVSASNAEADPPTPKRFGLERELTRERRPIYPLVRGASTEAEIGDENGHPSEDTGNGGEGIKPCGFGAETLARHPRKRSQRRMYSQSKTVPPSVLTFM